MIFLFSIFLFTNKNKIANFFFICLGGGKSWDLLTNLALQEIDQLSASCGQWGFFQNHVIQIAVLNLQKLSPFY
jgi:hypothetical protein